MSIEETTTVEVDTTVEAAPEVNTPEEVPEMSLDDLMNADFGEDAASVYRNRHMYWYPANKYAKRVRCIRSGTRGCLRRIVLMGDDADADADADADNNN